MKNRVFTVLMLAGLLAACASPSASRYYSLSMPAGAGTMPVQQPSLGLLLKVVEVPAGLARPQIVVRDPAQEPAVQILQQSLWSAPLEDQIQALLASGVAGRLGAVDVSRMPAGDSLPVRRIDVRLDRFDLVWGQGAELHASWHEQVPGQTARLCQAGISVPAAADGVAALVDAQRLALQRLAGMIAADPVPMGSSLAQAGENSHDISASMGCT